MISKRIIQSLLLATAAGSLLTGCIVVPAGHGPYYGGGGEVVAVAPPAPQVEVVGVAPFPGYIWLGGYWGWSGGRHAWVGGRWEAPRPGYGWAPHQWHREGQGWRFAPGRWERRG